MSDRFTHRCTEKVCPSFGQRSCYGSCKCHQTREQMMQSHIENLERLEAVELNAEMAEMLSLIANFHCPSQPPADGGTEYDWAMRHIARLRGMAQAALKAAGVTP